MAIEKIYKQKDALKQKMEKLKEQEAKLRERERKARNRRIFALGGLVEKSGLSNLETNQLYGALLEIADQAQDPEQLKRWASKGGHAFSADEKEKGEPVIVTFTNEPDREVRQQLRAWGLKWNAFRKEWQGRIMIDDTRTQWIQENHGKLRVL